MKKLFKQLLKSIFILPIILTSLQMNAQTISLFNINISNDAQISDRIMEFDLFVLDTDGSEPFEMAGIQAGITINPGIYNGGTITMSVVNGSSQLSAASGTQPLSDNTFIDQSDNYIVLTPRGLADAGSGTIISKSGNGTRVARLRITNSEPFTANSHADLSFWFTIQYYPTKIVQMITPPDGTEVLCGPNNCSNNSGNIVLNPSASGGSTGGGSTGGGSTGGGSTGGGSTGGGSSGGGSSGGGAIILPNAPTGTATQIFCPGASRTVANLAAVGTAIQWYSTSSGGIALATNTALENNTHYWASQTVNGRESSARFEVTVSINLTGPDAPTGIKAQSFCSGETVTNIALTGSAIQWYAASSGGVSLASNNVLENGIHYWASQTVTGCESIARFEVTALVIPGQPVNVMITSSSNPVFAGTLVHFTAIPTNGGDKPTYQWMKGGIAIPGANSTIYSYIPANNDVITCVMMSSVICPTPKEAASLSVTMIVEKILNGGTISGTSKITYGSSTGALTLGEHDGVIVKWQKSIIPGIWIDIANTLTTYSETPTSAGTWQYRSQIRNNTVLVAYSTPFSIVVSPIELTVGGSFTVNNKVYDGTTDATILSNNLILLKKVGSDIVYLKVDAVFADNAVGTGKAVILKNLSLAGADISNYTLSLTVTPYSIAKITPKELTVTGSIAQNKVYDGNNTVQITGATLSGVVAPDLVSLAGHTSGTLAQTGIGTDITVSTSLMTITGAGFGNYTLKQPTGLKANITAKELTITADNISKCNDGGVYGGDFLVTFSGFSMGEDRTVLGGTLTFIGTANGATSSGSYTIIPGGLTSQNYNITFRNGTLTINPSPVPIIIGLESVCVGTNGVIYTTNPNMIDYSWVVPTAGTITAGATTNSISVSWNAVGVHNVIAKYTNPNGCIVTPVASKNVIVNPIPGNAGIISGKTEVCAGSQSVLYTTSAISNTVSYTWTLPSGATIVSGAGTPGIIVNFADNALSGNISVNGRNLCGNGNESSYLAITVNPIPAKPFVTVNNNLLNSSAPLGNQWYLQSILIPGEIDKIYQAAHAGNYSTIVTLLGCSSDTSNYINAEELSDKHFKIYPNPNKGKFTVLISTAFPETFKINVYNVLGQKIYELHDVSVFGKAETDIDLGQISTGIYFVEFENNFHKGIRKILVNKY